VLATIKTEADILRKLRMTTASKQPYWLMKKLCCTLRSEGLRMSLFEHGEFDFSNVKREVSAKPIFIIQPTVFTPLFCCQKVEI
jgi:hypothetical protein